MPLNLRIAIFSVSIILFLVILYFFRNSKMPFKYFLVWMFPVIITFLMAIFPLAFSFFQNLMGFQTLSNMITGVILVLLIFVCIALTVFVSNQNKKITLLIQKVSLLEKKINEINK